MVCVYCGQATKVTNSRLQTKSNQVWRRRQCESCRAIFTTRESVDTAQALRVRTHKRLEAFSRDHLLLSIYDSLRHRKTATADATALTATILSQLSPLIREAIVKRDDIVAITATVLSRFDKVAATHYKAFHPASSSGP